MEVTASATSDPALKPVELIRKGLSLPVVVKQVDRWSVPATGAAVGDGGVSSVTFDPDCPRESAAGHLWPGVVSIFAVVSFVCS